VPKAGRVEIGDWRVLQEGMRALATDGAIGIYGVAPEQSATLDWSGTAAGLTITGSGPKRMRYICRCWAS
jgi:hypothetical protein